MNNGTNRSVRQQDKITNKNIAHYSLLIVHFSLVLLICSCDLFTGPKTDLFQVISDEVDWANAPKLAVRVEYPNTWGVSNPTGSITPAKDIRKGYAFEIEFTPNQAFSLEGWRAYRTASMPPNWTIDTTKLDKLETLNGASVEVPVLPARGGVGSFKINTTEAVTLVPWCKTEPYVTRTVPLNSPQIVYPRGTDIVIYFNAPLALKPNEPISTLFLTEKIKITADGTKISADDTCYNYPVYAANNDLGLYTITITASDVPGDKTIEVTVGPDIENNAGEKMTKAEVFSFSTLPVAGNGSITTWGASYNENNKTITVNWTKTGTGQVDVGMRYRVNQGGDNLISGTSPGTISSVSQPDISGVVEGRSVSSIQEYEIFLDLYLENVKSNAGSVSFKIWNIPGMNITYNTNSSNTVLLDNGNIRTALVAAGSSGRNFILTEDITLSGAWNPVGTGSDKFQGKFYGNGHTVTINSFAANGNTGLFGYTGGNAEIRDLTVNYASVSAVTNALTDNAITMGGIAGHIDGNTVIRNCIVRGTKISISYAKNIYAGSIAGYMHSTAAIENCFTDIELSATATGSGIIRAGGIVGYIDSTSVTASKLMINGVRVAGTTGATGGGSTPNVFIGGVVGECQGCGTIVNADVSGSVKMSINSSLVVDINRYYTCGGIIGKMRDGNLDTCNFTGTIDIPTGYNTASTTFIGGLAGTIGWIYSSNTTDVSVTGNTKKITVVKSNTLGNLNITTSGTGKFCVGGMSGLTRGSTDSLKVEVTDCAYSNGSISFTRTNYNDVIGGAFGGFIGDITGDTTMSNCRSNAGIIRFKEQGKITEGVHVGGFAGVFRDHIDNCYSISPIEATFTGNGSCSTGHGIAIGGFAGTIQFTTVTTTVNSCYATGSVDVRADSSQVTFLKMGGFAGYIDGSVTVEDCYALGDVTVDRSRGANETNFAGGFVGLMTIYGGSRSPTVQRCFSRGIVTARANKDVGGLYVGGMAGQANGTLKNCVSLAPYYTIQSGANSTRAIGRISSNVPATMAGNYAFAAQLYQDVYGGNTPTNVLGSVDAATKDGGTVSNFSLDTSWNSTSAGPGFNNGNSRWDFTGIIARGYPLLVGVGGQ